MLKKIIAVAVVFALAVSFGACKKKEEKQQLPAGHPPMEGGMPPSSVQNTPKVDRTVVVSNEVKATWKAVKIAIENKATKKTKEHTVNVGSELAVPDTNLRVKVLNFLPDFKMTDKEFMSSSNKPHMPAAQVSVTENGKEIWNNWLFSLQPGVHPFQHEAVGLVLIGGISK
jgi:hypothetical protein